MRPIASRANAVKAKGSPGFAGPAIPKGFYLNWPGEGLSDRAAAETIDGPGLASDALTQRLAGYRCLFHVATALALTLARKAEAEETQATARHGTYASCARDPQCQTWERYFLVFRVRSSCPFISLPEAQGFTPRTARAASTTAAATGAREEEARVRRHP